MKASMESHVNAISVYLEMDLDVIHVINHAVHVLGPTIINVLHVLMSLLISKTVFVQRTQPVREVFSKGAHRVPLAQLIVLIAFLKALVILVLMVSN